MLLDLLIRRPVWRLLFVCWRKPKGCAPLVHRDDYGFWDACAICGWCGPHTLLPSLRPAPLVGIAKNPFDRPSQFHFECMACQFDDDESANFAGPLDLFCPLCRADTGQANMLLRWPVRGDLPRSNAYWAFIETALDRHLNGAYRNPDRHPDSVNPDPRPPRLVQSIAQKEPE